MSAGPLLLRPLSLAGRWLSASVSSYGLPSEHQGPRVPLS